MESAYQSPEQQYFADITTRLRDMEEKNKLLKDRILLIGKNLVEDRENMFNEIQEMKKIILKVKEDQLRMQEFLKRLSDMVPSMARKEELMIMQRQMNLFIESLKHK